MENLFYDVPQAWNPEQNDELTDLLEMQTVRQRDQPNEEDDEEMEDGSESAMGALIVASRIEEMREDDPNLRKDKEQRHDHPVKIIEVSNDTYTLGDDESFYRVDPMQVEVVTKDTDPPLSWRHKSPKPQPVPTDPPCKPQRKTKIIRSIEEIPKEVDEKSKKRKKEKRKRTDGPESAVDPDNVGDFLIGTATVDNENESDDLKNKKGQKERKENKIRRQIEKEVIKSHCNRGPHLHRSSSKDDLNPFFKGYNYDIMRQNEEKRMASEAAMVVRTTSTIQTACCFNECNQPLSPMLKKWVVPRVDFAQTDDIETTPIPTPVKIPEKPKKLALKNPDLLDRVYILRMSGATFLRIFKNIPTGSLRLLTRKLNLGKPKHFTKEVLSVHNASKVPNAAAGEPIWTAPEPVSIADGSKQSFIQEPISTSKDFSSTHPAVQTRLTTPTPLQQDIDILLRQNPSIPGIVLSSHRSYGTKSSTSLIGFDFSSTSIGLPPSLHEIRAEIFEDEVRLIFTRHTRHDEYILMTTEPFSKDVGEITPTYEDGVFNRGNIQVEKEMERMTTDTMLRGLDRAPYHCDNLINIKQGITCPECGHIYVYPKVLKCMHMICTNCCVVRKELSANCVYKTYRCKECSEVTDFENWGLFSGFFMTEMARFLYSILNMREHFRCTNHPEYEKRHMIATVRCKQCRQNFCETCFKSHSISNDCIKGNPFMGHIQCEWLGNHWAYRDEYEPSQVITCKRHDDREIYVYCRRCNIGFCRVCNDYFHPHHGVQSFVPASRYVLAMKVKILEYINDLFPKAQQHLDSIERKLHALGKYFRFKTGEGKEVVNHLKTRLQTIIDKSWEPIRTKRQPEWQINIQRFRNIQMDLQKRYIFIKRIREIATMSEIMIMTKSPFLQNTQKLIETALPSRFNPYFQGFHLTNPVVNPFLSIPIVEYPFFHRIKVIDAMGDTLKQIQSITYMNGDLIAVHFDTDHEIPSSYYLHCKTHERQIHWTRKLRQCPKLYKVAFFQKEATNQNVKTEKLLALEYYDRREKVYKSDFEIDVDETSYHHLRAIDIDKSVEDYCTYLGDESYKPTAVCALEDEGYAYFSKSLTAHSYAYFVQSPFMTEDQMKVDKRKVLEKYISYPCAACFGPHQHVYILDKRSNNICGMNYAGFFTHCIQLGDARDIEVLDMCSSDTHFMILARYKNPTMDNVVIQYSFRNNTKQNVLTHEDGLEYGRCLAWNNDDRTLYVGCDDGMIREFKFPVVRKQKITKISLHEKCCDKDRGAEKISISTQTPV